MAIAINDYDTYSGSFLASHTLPDIDCSGTDTYALALGVNRNPGSDVSSWTFEGATPDDVAEFINAGTNSLQVKGDIVNDSDLTIVCNTPAFRLQSIIGVSLTGVDQSTPIAGKSTEKNEFTDTISDSYTGTSGNLLLVFITTQTDKTFTPINCTELTSVSNPDANLGSGFVGYITATGSSQTIGASWTGSLVAAMAIVEVAAAAGGGDDHEIETQDVSLGLNIDTTTIAQNHVIQPQDASIGLNTDNTTITQNHIVATQDVELGLTTDSTTIALNVDIETNDITLGLAVDTNAISQNHVITTQDIQVSLTEDSGTISQNHIISTQDIAITTVLDNATTTDGAIVPASPIVVPITIYRETDVVLSIEEIASQISVIENNETNLTVASKSDSATIRQSNTNLTIRQE